MARDRQRAKQRQAQRREARLAERAEREEQLAAGAPPEETGRSDTVVESPPPEPDFEPEEEFDEELEEEAVQAEAVEPVAAREPPERGRHPGRGRVLTFLANVVAELQRVQWPDRTALTSLTGIVLGFVLIAGGYLGLLDAVFSRIIKAIL
jgi:preprotein translocase SecE subunit